MNKKIFLTSMVALMIACPAYASLFNDPDASHQSGQIAWNSPSEDCDSDPLQYQGQAVGYGTYTLTAQWEEDECPITLNSHTGANEYGSTASDPTTLYARYADNVYLSVADRTASTNAMSTSANGLTTNPTGKTYILTLNTNVTTAGTGGMNAAHTDSQVTAASGTKAASTTATMSFAGFFDDATQLSKTQTNGTQYIDDTSNAKITSAGITAGTAISKVNGSCPSTEWHAQYTCQNAATYTPRLTGYTFAGWYDAANNGNQVNDFCLDSNKTVYAHWTPKQYNIIYQPGNCAGSSTTISNALTYDVNPNHYVLGFSSTNVTIPTGYGFDYWLADADGNSYVEDDVFGDSVPWQTDDNLVFTAVCGPNIYTVTYNCNGGSFKNGLTWNTGTTGIDRAAYDTSVYSSIYRSPVDTCQRSGYTLDSNASWSCTETTNNTTVPYFANSASTWDRDYNMECTINWGNADVYKIQYECGVFPGTNDMVYSGMPPVEQSVSLGSSWTLLSTAPAACEQHAPGYHFIGWYCDKSNINNCTAATAYNGTANYPGTENNHVWTVTATGTYGCTGNVYCRAVWAANNVNLIYLKEAGDATPHDTDTCVYGNSSFNLPSQPTKTGYTFTGWKVTNHQ